MKHKHHIIPKHMGGTDDPSNLVDLSIEDHAEAHRKLYEEHGHWQDRVAWQGLLGLIGHETIMREMYDARKGEGNFFYGKKHTEETKRIIGEKNRIANKGKKRSKEYIEYIRERMTGEGNPGYGKTPWNKGKQGVQEKRTPEQMASFSVAIIYEGVEYCSWNDAERQTGLSTHKLKKAGAKPKSLTSK